MDYGKDRYVFYGTAVFALVVAGSFLYGPETALVAVLMFACLASLGEYYYHQERQFVLACFLFTFGCLGIVVSMYHLDHNRFHVLDQTVGRKLTLTGVVCNERDVRDYNARLTLCVDGHDISVLVKTSLFPEYDYGDHLTVTGSLDFPEGFEGETGRYFDYQNYLSKDGIRYTMNYPEITLEGTREGHWLKQGLFDLKHWFISRLQSVLPEPQVSLLGGLLLGAKSAMGQDLLDDFRTTGVIHIVVLSGFNITVVVYFLMSILARLGQRTAATAGGIFILCFAVMTGAGATVVRASIMALLVILARVTGNQARVLRMLCLAGLGMLLWNPMLLLYDPGFQLSFLATFGLIILTPWVEQYLQWMPNWKQAPLRDLLAATISTQIMVTPLLLWMMGTFPTYSPVTNFLILATVPWVMLTGFLAGVCSVLSYQLAFVFITVTYVILTYQLWVVDIFANLPWASFTIPPFSSGWVALTYLGYAMIVYWLYLRSDK